MTTPPHHIAIVGCGFTGTSALHQLIYRTSVRAITVFEASGQFGPGYAYDPDECSDYLINNTTDTMCLEPNNKRAFLDWLETKPELGADLDPKGHLPRSVYGLFLQDSVAAARRAAKEKGVETTLITAEVERVEEDQKGGVTLSWPGGQLHVDAVIMCTGRCSDIDFCAAVPATASARYFNSHIGSDALDELPMDADVHILGASLSAYDIVNRLFSEVTGCRFERSATDDLTYNPGPNQRTVTLCSRSGRLKKMQSRAPRDVQRATFTYKALKSHSAAGELLLSDVAAAISADAGANQAVIDAEPVIDPYQGCGSPDAANQRAGEILEADIEAAKPDSAGNFLVDLLNDAQIDIWDAFADRLLSPEEERHYRTEIETALLSYAAPCPIPTAERLLALHRAGRLRVVRGVGIPVLSENGNCYVLEHAHGVEHASVLINATGKVDRDVLSGQQPPWIRHLVEAGQLQSYSRDGVKMAGADIEMTSFTPPELKHVHFANMLLWGPGFFTSSAFMMATVVSRILDKLFSTGSGDSPSET